MSSAEKFEIFLTDFEKAINGFVEILEINTSKMDAVLRDAVHNGQIQKFETCTELCWKTSKWYLEEKKGLQINSPVPVLKNLFTEKVIDEEHYLLLYDMIKDRNSLSHIYKEEMFIQFLPGLPKYLSAMKNLLEKLKK